MTPKTRFRLQPVLMNAVDPLGRPIEPSVLSVAQEIAPHALCYAEKFVGCPRLGFNLGLGVAVSSYSSKSVRYAILSKVASNLFEKKWRGRRDSNSRPLP